MKKIFSVFFVLILFVSVISQNSFAQEAGDFQNSVKQYNSNNGYSNSPIFIGNGNQQPDAINLWVIYNNGYITNNPLCPTNSRNYQRCEYLVLPSEMLASGFPSGATINSIGWSNYTAGTGGADLSGTLTIWLMNTANTTNTLGSTWTTSGFTQVHSGTFTPPITAYTDWDVAFSTPGAFTYTGGGVYVAWEFNYISGTAGTVNGPHYINTLMPSPASYYGSSATVLPTALTATASRAQTRFGNTTIVDIANVSQIYTLEKVPTPFGTPTPIGVYVSNVSASPQSFNVTVTVKNAISSAIRYTSTLPVTALAAGTGTTVNFTGWTPTILENDSIVATTSVISGETFTANNTKVILANVNNNTYSYNYSLAGAGGYGFTYPGTGLFGAKFVANGATSVTGANLFIANSAANTGNIIYAVLMDRTGTILKSSPNYTILAADLGTNKSFTFPTPTTITNDTFYVALAQTAGTAQWYPLGTFTEVTPRGNTFYSFALTGGPGTVDAIAGKYGIEAVVAPQPITGTWTEQVTSPTGALNSVSAVDDDVAWACGDGSKVLRTTNKGVNWTNVSGDLPTAITLYNIFAWDANLAICTGSTTSTWIYKTTNGGVSWTTVLTAAGGFGDNLWMTSATDAYFTGDPLPASGIWHLMKSTNGGDNWTTWSTLSTSNTGSWNNAGYFLGQQVWFPSEGQDSMMYSSNMGTNWVAQKMPLTYIGATYFSSPTSGLAGGGYTTTGLISTTNSGTNWTTVTQTFATTNITGITGAGNQVWTSLLSPAIWYSSDDGATWGATAQYTAPSGSFNHMTKARNGSTLWAVRSNGGISRYGSILVGVTPISENTPADYQLSQNYPNPFNPTTKISFALPKSGFVSLKVYDILGKEVATLVNSNMNVGSYSFEFNASNLTSGIYFYRLESNGFIDTKKMMLIK